MLWQKPGRRALIATLTVVAALLPVSLIAALEPRAAELGLTGEAAPAAGEA